MRQRMAPERRFGSIAADLRCLRHVRSSSDRDRIAATQRKDPELPYCSVQQIRQLGQVRRHAGLVLGEQLEGSNAWLGLKGV
jgi:hypothetical protein